MFEIYNLEKSFTSEYVKRRKTIANVRIALMDFKEKENRLDDFKHNVIPCLRNEIQSKSIVITDHEFDDIIKDKSQLFNKACTRIIFKEYLEDHKMKVSELQVILNDLHDSFLLTQTKTKKSKNVSKKVVSAKLKTLISQTNASKKVVSNDDGVKVAIAKKLVSNIDDGIDKKITTPISSKTKVSKNSQNAITYCISLFEDYFSKNSCKFTFLTIRCYCNF